MQSSSAYDATIKQHYGSDIEEAGVGVRCRAMDRSTKTLYVPGY